MLNFQDTFETRKWSFISAIRNLHDCTFRENNLRWFKSYVSHVKSALVKNSPTQWSAPWRDEEAYLTNMFRPVRQQGELVGTTQLPSSGTNGYSLR